MQAGDTVRYLNATGGGVVTRIEGQIAYVDEDGFETPVLARECVVVAHAGEKPTTTHFKEVTAEPKAPAVPAPTPASAPTSAAGVEEEPIEEIEGNDRLNLVLAWEPRDPKALGDTTYDTYLINDSNYYVAYAYMSRDDATKEWILRRAGTIEPNMQVLLEEARREMMARLGHVQMQWIAWKSQEQGAFEAKAPGWVERRLDTVKFFKPHCFRPGTYFDTPVIELPLVTDDVIADSSVQALNDKPKEKPLQERPSKKPVQRRPNKSPRAPQVDYLPNEEGIVEVDLHSHELFDNTRGLSNADILNRQIDEFERVMTAYACDHGRKIVFIHGKGEGVLRQALNKELTHRYKGKVDVQDASFRQYGFGATQVTIR